MAIIDGLSSFSSGLDFVSIARIVTICINGLIFFLMAAILKELLNMIYDLQENISNKEDKKIQFNQGEAQQKINEELNQYSDSIFFK